MERDHGLARLKERSARRFALRVNLHDHERLALRPKIIGNRILRLYAILYSVHDLQDEMTYHQWRSVEQTDALVLMHGYAYAVLRQCGHIVLKSESIGSLKRAFSVVTIMHIVDVPVSDTVGVREKEYIYIK